MTKRSNIGARAGIRRCAAGLSGGDRSPHQGDRDGGQGGRRGRALRCGRDRVERSTAQIADQPRPGGDVLAVRPPRKRRPSSRAPRNSPPEAKTPQNGLSGTRGWGVVCCVAIWRWRGRRRKPSCKRQKGRVGRRISWLRAAWRGLHAFSRAISWKPARISKRCSESYDREWDDEAKYRYVLDFGICATRTSPMSYGTLAKSIGRGT